MAKVSGILRGIGSIVVGSVVMIILALLYFLVTAWIVDVGVKVATGASPSADWTALSAAILTASGLAGSTYRSVASVSQDSGPQDYEGQEVA